MEKQKILIVEDQTMSRQLFEIFVKSNENYEIVASLDNADMAYIYCLRNPIDLILMDVMTKGGASGLVASRKIKQDFPNIKIIIVTSMPEYSFLKEAQDIGVEGFWYKEMNEVSVLEVIQRVIGGEKVYPERTPVVQIGLCTSKDFTSREMDVMKLIVRGCTDKEIAQSLCVSVETVHSKIKGILAKTGFNSRTKLAVALMGSGLIIDSEEK